MNRVSNSRFSSFNWFLLLSNSMGKFCLTFESWNRFFRVHFYLKKEATSQAGVENIFCLPSTTKIKRERERSRFYSKWGCLAEEEKLYTQMSQYLLRVCFFNERLMKLSINLSFVSTESFMFEIVKLFNCLRLKITPWRV